MTGEIQLLVTSVEKILQGNEVFVTTSVNFIINLTNLSKGIHLNQRQIDLKEQAETAPKTTQEKTHNNTKVIAALRPTQQLLLPSPTRLSLQ